MHKSALYRRLKLGFACALLPLGAIAAPNVMLDTAHPQVREVAEVQRRVTDNWMRQPEVLGTAVEVDENGATSLAVYVDRDSPQAVETVRSLPQQVLGVGVKIRLTDKFRAMRHRHRRRRGRRRAVPMGVNHRAFQVPPIQLGTSGGLSIDSVGRFCCGGTLGSLLQIGGQQYILSNWHVFEEDLVPGANRTVATTGDPIVQPGLDAVNCALGETQNVATLEKRSALPNNNVDCAIARVNPGMVRTDGAILEIGTISSQTVPAFIGQAVKKSGRTTGVTHSVVIGLNATVRVEYDTECNGDVAFNKVFTGQIMVARGNFLGDGDSGSLLVEDVPTNPRAVGLLFAGNTSNAIANPIGDVLAFLGASMVGN
jgi:hypothetical protein